jgi:ribosomal protein L17
MQMAKKKVASMRKRRSTEERVQELQKQIEALKTRAKAKELKTSRANKLLLLTVRTLDKAMESAREENNNNLSHALADARNPLEAYLSSQGMPLPKARRPRGPRPRA